MHILIISPTYYPAINFGGTVTAVHQLASSLCLLPKTDVTVITTNTSGEKKPLNVKLNNPVLVNGVNVMYFDSYPFSSTAFYSSQLINYLKNNINNYDIVYISSIWQIMGYAASKVCLKNKTPYVLGTHGSFSKILRKKSYYKKMIYYHFFIKFMLKNAESIHVTCKKEINDSGSWLNNQDFIIAPNIIKTDQYYITEFKKKKKEFYKINNIPENSKIILTVCRPDWMKRVDLILDSIKDKTDYYLVFIGDDKKEISKEWIQKAESLGLSRRFINTGILKGLDLIEMYNIADVFVLISENENFSMVVVEALMCGTPCVISENVGVADYLISNKHTQIVDLKKANILNGIKHTLNQKFDKNNVRKEACRIFEEKSIVNLYRENFNKIQKSLWF
jgi:glycosyltransferase involved in cell wall biosynthesis